MEDRKSCRESAEGKGRRAGAWEVPPPPASRAVLPKPRLNQSTRDTL